MAIKVQNMVGLDIDDLLLKVKKAYDSKSEECNLLREKIRDYDRDQEIQQLKAEIKHLKEHSLYQMSPVQKERLEQFHKEHFKTCASKHKRATPFYYEIIKEGSDTTIVAQCLDCFGRGYITDFISTLW